MDKERTFFLDQHGCAKNQVDGELLMARLEAKGLVRVDDPARADVIIVNSCGFIESAKKESLDSVMDARASYPHAKILLAGCLAERYASVFESDLPEADGILGNGDLSLVDKAVDSLFAGGRPVLKAPQKGVCGGDRDTLLSFTGSAYVKITEGCDNHCTFCAIPLIRGDLRSRPIADVVAEVRSLVSRGVKEINLIGQDLAAYGHGQEDGTDRGGSFRPGGKSFLLELMEAISEIPGQFWVRLLYIHPDHFNTDILGLMKKDTRFLPYFDIPFQSGDDGIIRAMNRKGTAESYIRLVEEIRSVLPEASLRTTFLTGFPGESEAAAENTRAFLKAIQSDWSGCFSYSSEEGTPAARMKGKVPHKKAEERAAVLGEIQASITQERLKSRVGKSYDVLVEEIIENKDGTDEGLAIGRAWFEAPEVDGNVVISYDLDDPEAVRQIVPGSFVTVRALASSEFDISAEWIG
ncbi:MAG: 30S ribosomal protein S12 methylthiotransferase RimO [Treponema sp.]|nr:30S ribosomal protein S12 methylthiotransferase RimO [Treponema sp.]